MDSFDQYLGVYMILGGSVAVPFAILKGWNMMRRMMGV